MTVGVLALQGAFQEHMKMLEQLGVSCVELRQKKDLKRKLDGLVLPGGESTVQGKLLRELDMFTAMKERIEAGLPVLATCAGMILLAEEIEGQTETYLGTLPVTVKRNAYGRQLGSFTATGQFEKMEKVPMRFIRAPYITNCDKNVTVLSRTDGNVTGVKYRNQIAISFHPELGNDTRIHEYFLQQIRTAKI